MHIHIYIYKLQYYLSLSLYIYIYNIIISSWPPWGLSAEAGVVSFF